MSTADDIKRLAENYRSQGVMRGLTAQAALYTAIDALQSQRDSLLEALIRAESVIRGLECPVDTSITQAIRKASEGKAA